jgi:cytochrome c551/c552
VTLRSVAELVAYGSLAVLLTLGAISPTETSTATASTTSVERGRALFATKGCIGCHTHLAVSVSKVSIGPDLTAIASRAGQRVPGLDARSYVRQSIVEPDALLATTLLGIAMPVLPLTADEVDELVAFLIDPR